MNNIPFCDDFQDLLDAYTAGTLTREEADLFHSHANSCETCAMILKIHENMAAFPVDEITNTIPETMVQRLWDRISNNRSPGKSSRRPAFSGSARRPWLMPVFAVTTILFVLLNIFLFSELRQFRTRERRLTTLLSQQTRVLEEIRDQRLQASTARSSESAFNKNRLRLISGQKALSVAELRSFLEQVPPDLQILTGSYITRLLSQLPGWERVKWEKALESIDSTDGIQSREAILLLEALSLDPNDTITPARLAALTEF